MTRSSVPSRCFSIGLGSFRSVDAVATLPAQLAFLRTLADAGPTWTMVYRLRVKPDGDGGVAALFTVSGFLADDVPDRDGEAASMSDLVRSTFVGGWNLTGADEPLLVPHRYVREIVVGAIQDGALPVPQVREDWAAAIDVLRRREHQTALTFIVQPVDGSFTSDLYAEYAALDLHLTHSSDEGATQKAAGYFESLKPGAGSALVSVRMLLSSTHHIPEPTTANVARTVLGPLPWSPRSLRSTRVLDSDSPRYALPPEWLLRIVHPPYGHFEGRGVRSGMQRRVPFTGIRGSESGIVIGQAISHTHREDAHHDVVLSDAARLRHVHVIGKTGSGKTNLLKHMIRQDLARDCGVAVIDPHGELVDYALAHCGARKKEVTLLDFTNETHMPILNPLDLDVEDDMDRDLAIEELVDIVVQRTFNQFTGPVFDDTARMLLETLFEPEITALAVPSIAYADRLMRSKESREWIQRTLQRRGSELGDRWATFNGMLATTLAENVRWVLSKFTDFSRPGALRPVVGGGESTVSIKKIVDDRSVLLVKVPEGTIGSNAAGFLGSLIFSRIRRAAFAPTSARDPRPFHLYLDEFQRFVSRGFEEIVAEARKFNLGLVVAHQNLRQLDHFSRFEGQQSGALREALFGNVGNRFVMRVAGADAAALAPELGLSADVLRRINQYEALATCIVDGAETDPFSLLNIDADEVAGAASNATAVRRAQIASGRWVRRDALERNFHRAMNRIENAQKRSELGIAGSDRRLRRGGQPPPPPLSAFDRQRLRPGDVRATTGGRS